MTIIIVPYYLGIADMKQFTRQLIVPTLLTSVAFGLVNGAHAQDLPDTFMQDAVFTHLATLGVDANNLDWRSMESSSPLCADNSKYRLVIVNDYDQLIHHDNISSNDAQSEMEKYRSASGLLLDYSEAQPGEHPEVAAVYSMNNDQMKVAYPSATDANYDCTVTLSLESISIDAASLDGIEEFPIDLQDLVSNFHDFDPTSMTMNAVGNGQSRPSLVCLDTGC